MKAWSDGSPCSDLVKLSHAHGSLTAPLDTATRLATTETSRIEASLTRVEAKVDKNETTLNKIKAKVDTIEAKVDTIDSWVVSATATLPVAVVSAGSMINVLTVGQKALTTTQLCKIGGSTTAIAIVFFASLHTALLSAKKTP